MKRILLAAVALSAMTAAVSAADLPRRMAPPIFTPVPVFTWSGFYAGFNAGYGFDVSSNTQNIAYGYLGAPNAVFPAGSGVVALGNQANNDGFVGGGQVGYNVQLTPGSGVVFGIEADAQYIDLGRRRNNFTDVGAAFGLGPVGAGSRFSNPSGISSLEFFGTVRGRIGYAFDRVLFYGTGGFAYGSTGEDFASSNTGDFRTGFAAGGGIEYALPTDSFLNFFRSSAVTFKVEALYVNLNRGRGDAVVATNGATQIRLNDPALGVFDQTTAAAIPKSTLRNDTEFAVIRAGINYKFGSY